MPTPRTTPGLAALLLCLAAAACAPSAADDAAPSADGASADTASAAVPADPHAGLPGRPPAGPAPLDSAEAARVFAVLPFDAAAVPAALEHVGDVVGGARWRDRWGENWLLLTSRGPVDEECEEQDRCLTAELHAYTYVVRPDTAPHLLWKTVDSVRNCPFDVTAAFVPGAVHVTDLDHDGTAEATYATRTACRSDVSPAAQKLVMHEANRRYTIRGSARLPAAAGGEGGERSPERGFDTAGPALKEFALRVWDENVEEEL